MPTPMTSDHSTLLRAAHAHYKHTGHHSPVLGNNFVECRVCKLHAHLFNKPTDPPLLIMHNADYTIHKQIGPDEFFV